jgi:hypothetical protein
MIILLTFICSPNITCHSNIANHLCMSLLQFIINLSLILHLLIMFAFSIAVISHTYIYQLITLWNILAGDHN